MISLTLAVDRGVSINIVKPVLGKKIGRFTAAIVAIVLGMSGLISGIVVEGWS